MVFITEELVRKKSEHNEGIIRTLEELSLHQEDVEKIEHIHNWAKGITILYLQANLIEKIENLNKLKDLQYLNLAINNIEKIENLQRCEKLEKLDLTLNFIGDLQSVCSLQNNEHLRHLYLTGNPCTDYKYYREYVIAKLPQLETLDNVKITRSERIKAMQIINDIDPGILIDQQFYEQKRTEQKLRLENAPNDLDDDTFWKTSSENAPETRVEISRRLRKNRETDKSELIPVNDVKLFNKDGKPLNVNQAKVSFRFDDSDQKQLVLDLGIYRFLDTSLLDVDVQPSYVKVLIKKKVFQFVLPEEILTDKSLVQRSKITGHLVITMPKLNYDPKMQKTRKVSEEIMPKKESVYLEVDCKKEDQDFSKIMENYYKNRSYKDNPDVPPLEYG